MAVKVLIPQQLLKLTKGKSEIETPAGTILNIVKEIDRQFPGIIERIMEGEKIRKFVNIYVNEEDTRFLKEEETLVEDGTEVSIVPALVGG